MRLLLKELLEVLGTRRVLLLLLVVLLETIVDDKCRFVHVQVRWCRAAYLFSIAAARFLRPECRLRLCNYFAILLVKLLCNFLRID